MPGSLPAKILAQPINELRRFHGTKFPLFATNNLSIYSFLKFNLRFSWLKCDTSSFTFIILTVNNIALFLCTLTFRQQTSDRGVLLTIASLATENIHCGMKFKPTDTLPSTQLWIGVDQIRDENIIYVPLCCYLKND